MRALLSALLSAVLAATIAPPAQAAHPGRPGPITFPMSITRAPDFVFEWEGGLFMRGPRHGQRPRRLTFDRGDTDPTYSPSGRLLAFSSERAEGHGRHLFVMRSDGGGVRQLTHGLAHDEDPYFSADGRRLVFARQRREGGPRDIYTVGVDGRRLRQLTSGPADEREPTYMPSGRRIIYVSDVDQDGIADRGDLWSMDPRGERRRILIDSRRSDADPDVSPNGRLLVFRSYRPAAGVNLYLARSDGRRVRPLTRRSCRACSGPAFSPDGRYVIALRDDLESSSIERFAVGRRGRDARLASGSVEEEGLGTTLGAPTWGPAPRR